jgi:hypothetical protein
VFFFSHLASVKHSSLSFFFLKISFQVTHSTKDPFFRVDTWSFLLIFRLRRKARVGTFSFSIFFATVVKPETRDCVSGEGRNAFKFCPQKIPIIRTTQWAFLIYVSVKPMLCVYLCVDQNLHCQKLSCPLLEISNEKKNKKISFFFFTTSKTKKLLVVLPPITIPLIFLPRTFD